MSAQGHPAPDPFTLQSAARIIELRRRFNSSGQVGEDMANIIAELSKKQADGRQLGLLDDQIGSRT